MAETHAQTIDITTAKIFEAIDQHGDAMRQRLIREALEDMYTVVYNVGFDAAALRGPVG